MDAIGSPQRKLSGKVSNPNVAQAKNFGNALCGGGGKITGGYMVYVTDFKKLALL